MTQEKVHVPDMLERLAKWQGTVAYAARVLGMSRTQIYMYARYGVPMSRIRKWRESGHDMSWLDDVWRTDAMQQPWTFRPVDGGYRVGPALFIDADATDEAKLADADQFLNLISPATGDQ